MGALNLDYLVTGPGSLLPVIAGIAQANGDEFKIEGETAVTAATIAAAIAAAGEFRPVTELGGSAFNTLCAAAYTGLQLRLGYVGVAGRSPVAGVDSKLRLGELGIDHRMVYRDREYLCGTCFALTERGERTLMIHTGANDLMAGYLARESAQIVKYLASAAIVHVSSFLHEHTPEPLLAVLRAVKNASPTTRISLDPGGTWCADPRPVIQNLLELADYLLVNDAEFRALAEGQSVDSLAAEHILRNRAKPAAVLAVKRPAGIWWYRQVGGQLMSESCTHRPLSSADIKDATGAGDVFAAGLLSVLAQDPHALPAAARTGLRLARHSLRHTGTAGHADFRVLLRHPAGW